MKNKKLIATVASLCLVLVAVVAAVVGILAAAQQTTSTKIQVRYNARLVAATVSLESKAQHDSDWSTAQSTTFYAQEVSEDRTLAISDEKEIGTWSDGANAMRSYVVYRFTFTNNNNNKNLKVVAKYDQNTAPTNMNLYWFKGTNKEPSFDVHYTAAGLNQAENTTPAISTPSNLTLLTAADWDSTNKTHTVFAGTNTSLGVSTGSNNEGYFFLVVAIADVNAGGSYFISEMDTTGNLLEFTLTPEDVTTP